jgi:hypothetical protein
MEGGENGSPDDGAGGRAPKLFDQKYPVTTCFEMGS